jgi:hypothetical protein
MPTSSNLLRSAHPRSRRRLPPLPDHEPTPTDFMLYKQWPPDVPSRPEPLPMLPMPPIPPAAKRRRAKAVRSLLQRKVAAIAAGILLCGLLFGSAALWITHHASTTSVVTLALQQDTLRA